MAAPVIVVSGLPRSGTSMAMQMLQAGGVSVLTDQERQADADNPRGYLELERVKQLRTDKSWVADAEGKAVKIIHLLLMELPTDREYRVLFMRRDLREVVKSQGTMLERSGKKGAALPAERLMAVYEQQLRTVEAWLAQHPLFKVLDMDHRAMVTAPQAQVDRVCDFLGMQLDRAAMVAAVDPSLHRNKA